MRSMSRSLLGVLFTIIVIEIVMLAPMELGMDEEGEFLANQTESAQVSQSMLKVHSIGSKDEKKEWELWADQAQDFTNKEEWNLENVKAMFFTEDGDSFQVTGDQGRVDLETKNMKVEGNVITTSSNGYVFITDVVIYNSDYRVLQSPGDVQMTGPADPSGHTLSLEGRRMETDLKQSMMAIESDVQGQKGLPDGKVMKIQSQGAKFSGKSHSAQFLGDVVIDYDSMRITGPQAEFQYNDIKKQITGVEIDGGVRVSDVDKWATSEQVSLDLLKDRYVFTGSPRVVQNRDELFGEEIVFTNRGKSVQVKKARAKVTKDRVKEGQ